MTNPTPEIMWLCCNHFVRRLFAKGGVSVHSVATGTSGIGVQPEVIRDVVRFLAGATPEQTESVITATVESADEHRVFADWLMGVPFEDTFDRNVFDRIEWRFNTGWRNRYPKGEIPHMGQEPPPKPKKSPNVVSAGYAGAYKVNGGPWWFGSGTRAQAERVDGGHHPTGHPLGPKDKTCGDCTHLCRGGGGGRTYFKCGLDRAEWTHGPGSDLRRRWKACDRFKP